jgi:hypothetical protein
MFLWKNAIILIALLGLASFVMMRLVRLRWEKRYLARIILCGMLVACIAVSAVPMIATQFIFMLLMLSCFDRRVPMAATYFFFLFWTPAAGSLLAVGGAYIAPITPFLSFSGALLFGYLIHPENHLRRRFSSSDIAMFAFILIYCVCMSLRDTPTGVARTIVTYFIPYVLTYQMLSRMKIESPELVMRMLLFGAAAASLLCLFESVRHWPLYAGIMGVKNELWTIDNQRIWLERGGITRAYGPYAHPLTGGAMLGLAAIVGWALWQIRGRSLPLAFLGLLTVAGLGSTLSRSGLVALAVGLATFQFLRGRYLLALLVPLGGVVMLVALPILGGEDAQFSTAYRLGLIAGVPAAMGNHVWIGFREGVPQGMFDAFIQGQGIVDLVNTYVALIVEGGLVSLAAFLVFLFSAYPQYRAIRKMKPDREQLVLAQLLISLHTALVVALFLLSSWTAPMQIAFLDVALLVALRAQLSTARKAAAPRLAPLVATQPVDQGERLPVLR